MTRCRQATAALKYGSELKPTIVREGALWVMYAADGGFVFRSSKLSWDEAVERAWAWIGERR